MKEQIKNKIFNFIKEQNIWSDDECTDEMIETLFDNINLSDEEINFLEEENIELFDLYSEIYSEYIETGKIFVFKYVFRHENGTDILYGKDKISLAKYIVDNIVINEKEGEWETLDINQVLDDIEEIARQE